MEIKRVSQCSIEDIVTAWNRGFEGYYGHTDITNVAFIKRMVGEDLISDLSLVAFDEGEPIAIIMNGLRVIGGKKVVWNGGTGIATSFRGTGLSNLLMEEVLEIYKSENADIALLEAIENNDRAIKLYKKHGYEMIDELILLENVMSFSPCATLGANYTFKSILPEQLAGLTIYNENVPWQCQWQSVKGGEALLVINNEREIMSYALFKRVFNANGELERVILYQLEVSSPDLISQIFCELLSEVKNPVKITAMNFCSTAPVTQNLLELGFKKTVGQVHMKQNLKPIPL